MCKRLLLIKITILLSCFSIGAQENLSSPWVFRHITFDNGLASSNVLAIGQDKDGFWWFGTDNGLQRFDGVTFKTFRHAPENPWSIPGDHITTLTIDRSGKLWVACGGKGVAYYDKMAQKFIPVPGPNGNLKVGFPSRFLEDAKGDLWFITTGIGEGLYRLPKGKNTWEQIPLPQNYRVIGDLICENTLNGDLWFRYLGGLAFLERRSGRVYYSTLNPDAHPLFSKISDPESFTMTKDNNFWIVANNSANQTQTLHKYNFRQNTLKIIFKRRGIHRNNLIQTHSGEIWNFREGLNYFVAINTSTDTYRKYHFGPEDNRHPLFKQHSPGLIFEDQESNIWLASLKGISVFNPIRQKFKIFENVYDVTGHHLELSTPIKFFQSSKGEIWVGTYFEGLFVFDEELELKRHYLYPKSPPGTPDSLANQNYNAVWDITEDKQGRIWAVGQLGTIQVFSPDGTLIKKWRPEAIGPVTITLARTDRYGQIWLTINNGNLTKVNPANFAVEVFQTPVKDQNTPRIEDIFFDYDNDGIFLTNLKHGLIWFDRSSKKQSILELPVGKDKSKLLTGLIGIKPLKDNNLLLHGEGTYRFDTGKKTIEPILLPEGRNLNHIRSLVITKNNSLWLGTKTGLAQWQPEKDHVAWYHYRDGLADKQFETPNLFYYLRDGRILASTGQNGFFYFHPDSLLSASPPPNVILDAIRLGNEEISPPEAGKTLLLRHDQNNLSVRFVCLSWQQQPGLQYRYRLSGQSKEWIRRGKNREVSLNGLSPGRYTLEIQAVNRDGLSSPGLTTLSFRIRPPWWWSPLAWLIYLAIFCLAAYRWYRFQLQRKLEKAEARRLKELDSFKSDFYQNITHEFRTPLTVITGLSESMMANVTSISKDNLESIRRNGHRLLDMVNQLLDLSRMERGKLVLHDQCGDIIPLLKITFESIHSWASSRQINATYSLPESEVVMDHDPEKFQQVLLNLLSNAVKFTPEEGSIQLTARLVDAKDFPTMHFHYPPRLGATKWLSIEVQDTGVGIPEKHLPHIFNRFYQVEYKINRRAEGTGIGLAFVAELVGLMGGGIAVRSQPDYGSTFAVVLPVTQKAPMVQSPAAAPAALWQHAPVWTRLKEDMESDTPTILIVEDNADMAAYIALCLEEKYRLLHVVNGIEGLEVATREVPDLVLSDVMMPEMDGLELCGQLKSEESTSHIPIILLTARAGQENKLEGLRRGADEYLVKPFHREELLLRIEGLLESRRRLQERYRQLAGIGQESEIASDAVNTAPEEDEFLRKVREIVDARLGDPGLSIGTLCRELFLGASQFNRKLSALTGYTAVQYIRQRRMKRAKSMLRETTLGVAEVATAVGYEDPSFFTRSFRQDTGMSPSHWREKGE